MTWLREMFDLCQQYLQADRDYRAAMKQIKKQIKEQAHESLHPRV